MKIKRKITLKFHAPIKHLAHFLSSEKHVTVINDQEMVFRNLEDEPFYFGGSTEYTKQRICIRCVGTQYNFDANEIANVSIDQWE